MNILWFCTDQQRVDTLGCYGNEYVRTPNIDKLAKNGVKFNNAYAQSSVCTPSRASFLTGRYPRTTCARQNGQSINENERLISKILSEHGYTCGLSGKLHISPCFPKYTKVMEKRIDDGYDYFRWSHHSTPLHRGNWPMHDYTMWLTKQGIDYKTEALPDCTYIQVGMPEEYSQVKWCVDCAMEYMQSAQNFDMPWFFSINCFDPHPEFNPPKKYLDCYIDMLDELPLPNYQEGELESKPIFQTRDHGAANGIKGNFVYDEMSERDHRYVKASYWAMCDLIDSQVGRVVEYLEKSGQLEDTLIIFGSDHGEHLGDHGMYLKGPCFYESDVHVPLIMSHPTKLPKGVELNQLVELVDIAPTLCQMTGIDIPESMQGKSLCALLNQETTEHRKTVYSEYYNSGFNIDGKGAFVTMLYDGRYKLIKIHDKEDDYEIVGELYDLQEDPDETYNQYYNPEYVDIKIRLFEKMTDRMAETCDPMPTKKCPW